MTEKVHLSGYCPVCEYTFEKTVTQETVQTALSNYNDTEEAVQNFCGGELPLNPTQIALGLSIIANFLQIGVNALEAHNIRKTNKSSIDADCPECGSSQYDLEIEQK